MASTFTNRLSRETSPYLLQHQHNPVDWYPWGEEAFAAARAQDKPIFLSVGYSTCYWCHVMERQSFENAQIAALMNEKFINIKVDREERPDVDQLYMTAVQVLTRSGGWPMSVWLLPDLRVFFGGTYFPPQDTQGRPGFPNILEALSDAYNDRRPDLEETAGKLHEVIAELAEPTEPDEPMTLSMPWIKGNIDRSALDYDGQFGGFGAAPKFPRETLLQVLLQWARHTAEHGERDTENDKALRHTLDAMANGGIRDQLGGGFHRYSTDAQWLVPHFEIMLYDNAMLAWVYAEASQQFNEPRYATVARGIADFVLREMTSPQGGFYTAFDAEVDAKEGLNYLWTMPEIEQVLSPREAAQFAQVYGLDTGPNFADPHHGDGTPDKNILHLPNGPARESDPAIVEMRSKLYAYRLTRKQPLLDTKIITSWNALMIRGLAHVGSILSEPMYLQAAEKAADFLLKHHRKPDGSFYRTSREGQAKYEGFLDDYAFLAQALLELHRATSDARWRAEAEEVANQMRTRFEDAERGGFYFTDEKASDLIVRQKVGSDSPLPAGAAVAARVCDELGHTESAAKTLASFAVQTNHHGPGMSAMLQAILQFVSRHGPLRAEPTEQQRRLKIEMPDQQAMTAVTPRFLWTDDRTLAIDLEIAAGFHLSRDADVSSPAATSVRPLPEAKTYDYADAAVEVYHGTARFVLNFPEKPAAGVAVPVILRYQACTDSACLPPVTRTLRADHA
ncbi:MAG TPA: DUF255 domain-containing protein [Tepidisphaeraceae bacterium]